MALQFKRGTEELRQETTLAIGEPFYVTDHAEYGVAPFYIGNGVTPGGIPVLNITNFAELYDVYVYNPQNNQIAQWNTANGRWENTTDVELPGTLGVTGAVTLNNENVTATNRMLVTTDGVSYNSLSQVLGISHGVDWTASYTSITTGAFTQLNGVTFNRGAYTVGTPIRISTVGGASLSPTTTYYVYDVNGTTFKLASTKANALSATPMASSGTALVAGTTNAVPEVGIGTTFKMNAEVQPGVRLNSVLIDGVSTDITAGSEDFDLVVRLRSAGSMVERFRLTSEGLATLTQLNATTINVTNLNASSVSTTGALSGSSVTVTGAVSGATLSTTGNATVGGALTVTGNLTVNGTTTTIDTNNVVIEDNTILLNKNEAGLGVTAGTAGIEVERGTANNVAWLWDETNKWWKADAATSGEANIWATGKIIAGTDLGSNEGLTLNYDDTTLTSNIDIAVRRGASADVKLRWNYTTNRWQFTNDGSNYTNLLVSTDSPTFAGLTLTSGLNVSGIATSVRTGTGIPGTETELNVSKLATGSNDLEIVSNGKYLTLDAPEVRIGYGRSDASALTTTTVDILGQNVSIGSDIAGGSAVIYADRTYLGSTDSAATIYFNAPVDGTITFDGANTNGPYGIKGQLGLSDYWFVGGKAAGSDNGYLELATGDNGAEPIYARQYIGLPNLGSVARTAEILDSSGNTYFPGEVNAGGSVYAASNLYAQGNTIVLKNNATGTPSIDALLEVRRGDEPTVALRWNESTNKWQFTNDGTTYSDLGAGALSLGDLTDVVVTTPNKGQIITYNGTDWVNGARTEFESATYRRTFVNKVSPATQPIQSATVMCRNAGADTLADGMGTGVLMAITNDALGTAGQKNYARVGAEYSTTGDHKVVMATSNNNFSTWSDSAKFGASSVELLKPTLASDYIEVKGKTYLNATEYTATSTSADQVLDTTQTGAGRTIKYLIQAEYNGNLHSFEAMVVTTGTMSYITTYAEIQTNGSLTTISTDVNAGSTRLLVTPANTGTVYRVTKIAIY